MKLRITQLRPNPVIGKDNYTYTIIEDAMDFEFEMIDSIPSLLVWYNGTAKFFENVIFFENF